MDNAGKPTDLIDRLAGGRQGSALLRGQAPLEMSEQELAAVRHLVDRGSAVPAIFVRALLARLDRAEGRGRTGVATARS